MLYLNAEVHHVTSVKVQRRVRDGYTVTYFTFTGPDGEALTFRAFHDATALTNDLVVEIPDETL